MTKNVRRHVEHKLVMALISAEQGDVSNKECLLLHRDVKAICEDIKADYDSQYGAGALWLDRKLKDPDWLYDHQETVIKKARKGLNG